MMHHAPVFKKRLRGSLFEISMCASLCASIVTFFTGSFAETIGLDASAIALVYAISAVVSIATFIYIPTLIRLFGSKPVLLGSALLYTLTTFGMGVAHSYASLLVPCMINMASFGALLAMLDIYLEHSTDASHREGEVRGIYLGLQNAGYIIGPFVGGLLLTVGGYTALFWASTIFMMPVLGVIYEHMKNEPVPEKPAHHTHLHHAGLTWAHGVALWGQRQLRTTYLFYFLLRMFFALTGIYTAIFLNEVHHLSPFAIGSIIAISLLPMAVVELPVGRLLDTSWDHGHVGMAGFGIIAITCALVPFVESSSAVVWSLLFFAMRIGASLVEIVAETYFFSLAGNDTQKVGLFRATYPLAYIVAPACAAGALALSGFEGLFYLLAFLSLFGAYLAHSFTPPSPHIMARAHEHARAS